MPYANIKKLLSKKGWTGEEVGKALLANTINDIKNIGTDYAPLFSLTDFRRMEASLTKERDFIAYNVYRSIYYSLVETYNKRETYTQQFFHGYYRYFLYLHDALKAEISLQTICHTPYVITEEQYNTALQQATADMKKAKDSYADIFFNVLYDTIDDPDNAPDSIIKALNETKTEPISNKRILDNFNQIMGNGYYTLGNFRSDEMPADEWDDIALSIIASPIIKDNEQIPIEKVLSFYKTRSAELFYKGIEEIRTVYYNNTGKELPEDLEADTLRELELISNSGVRLAERLITKRPPKPTDDIINALISNNDIFLEWSYYEQIPEGLTKYDIVTKYLCVYDDEKPLYNEFIKDYPALSEAVKQHIESLIPAIAELKPTQTYKKIFSYGELAKLGIKAYIKNMTPSNDLLADYIVSNKSNKERLKERIINKGIVIAKNAEQRNLDKSGNFKDEIETVLTILHPESIEGLNDSGTLQADIKDLIARLIEPAFRYLYAYNALIDILGDVYDIAEFEVAKINTDGLEEQANAFNKVLYSCYADVYGTEEEKENKRCIFDRIFTPIYPQKYKPINTNVEIVRLKLLKLDISPEAENVLQDFDSLIDIIKGETNG